MSDSQNDNSFSVMVGARGILDRTGGAVQIRQQVEAIEQNLDTSPPTVFDLSKALVETVCKTVLKDKGVSHDNGMDAPALLKETMIHLQLFPRGHEAPAEVTSSLKKTANGLLTAIQGLCELRNNEGMASHGRDAYAKNLDAVQAELSARTADIIVQFIWGVHRSYEPLPRQEGMVYDDHTDANEWVDDLHNPPVTIFGSPFKQSEILFYLDRESYRNALLQFQDEQEDNHVEHEDSIDSTASVED